MFCLGLLLVKVIAITLIGLAFLKWIFQTNVYMLKRPTPQYLSPPCTHTPPYGDCLSGENALAVAWGIYIAQADGATVADA